MAFCITCGGFKLFNAINNLRFNLKLWHTFLFSVSPPSLKCEYHMAALLFLKLSCFLHCEQTLSYVYIFSKLYNPLLNTSTLLSVCVVKYRKKYYFDLVPNYSVFGMNEPETIWVIELAFCMISHNHRILQTSTLYLFFPMVTFSSYKR